MATKAARAESSAPAVAAPPVAALDAPSAAAPELKLSYEEALAELEQLVSRMEAGSLPLDQLLTAYQRGATLLAFCRGRLEAVEAQVKVLEDGQLQPWNDA
jgi:exodeoxyribonuclease VII small subunit